MKFITYAAGLFLVAAGAWFLLVQTPEVAEVVPTSVSLSVILLIMGGGLMGYARGMQQTGRVQDGEAAGTHTPR